MEFYSADIEMLMSGWNTLYIIFPRAVSAASAVPRPPRTPLFRDDRHRFDESYSDDQPRESAPDDSRQYERHPRGDETRSRPIFECVRSGATRSEKQPDDLPKIPEQVVLEDAVFIANEKRKISPPNGLF
jgi:hypothetical protein